MADFCKQCSIDTFGEDTGDHVGHVTREEIEYLNRYPIVLCEGCGGIQVDHTGRCISRDCIEKHGPPLNEVWLSCLDVSGYSF